MEQEIIHYINIVTLQNLNYLSSLIEKNSLMTMRLSFHLWIWLEKWINFLNLLLPKKCAHKFVLVTVAHRTKLKKDMKYYMEDFFKYTEDQDKIIHHQILI